MFSWPSVHIVCGDIGGIEYEAKVTADSLQREINDYPGDLHVSAVKIDPSNIGGGLLTVTNDWVKINADIVGFLPFGFIRSEGAIRRQIDHMLQKDLVACYGDVAEVSAPGKPLYWEAYREFNPDMIGVESVPIETFLFDFKKFKAAQGLYNVIPGSYRPNSYLVTVMATVGRIGRIDEVVVERLSSVNSPSYQNDGIMAWDSEESAPLWTLFRFDRFVRQAKSHYSSMGWYK